jgi:hypothetical protein
MKPRWLFRIPSRQNLSILASPSEPVDSAKFFERGLRQLGRYTSIATRVPRARGTTSNSGRAFKITPLVDVENGGPSRRWEDGAANQYSRCQNWEESDNQRTTRADSTRVTRTWLVYWETGA